MTTFTTPYSFMDLLKDYDYVPEIRSEESDIIAGFKNRFAAIGESTADYSFMDLMKEKGQVPEIVANDNSILEEIEETLEELVSFVEDVTEDYSIIDLVRDRALVPAYANDNERLRLIAS